MKAQINATFGSHLGWRAAIHEAERLCRASPKTGSDKTWLLAVDAAVSASHYAFLLSQIQVSRELLIDIEPIADAIRDQQLRLAAQVTRLRGWHWFFRNHWAPSEIDDYARTRTSLRKQTAMLARDCDSTHAISTLAARMELANHFRVDGRRKEALELYEDVSSSLTMSDDHAYHRALFLHYIISLACDYVELVVLPESLQAPRALNESRDQIEEFLCCFPEDATTRQYPFLHTLARKHYALLLAAARPNESEDALRIARMALNQCEQDFKTRKGVLLCREFEALITEQTGDQKGAIELLKKTYELGNSYYPRGQQRVAIHLSRLTGTPVDSADWSAYTQNDFRKDSEDFYQSVLPTVTNLVRKFGSRPSSDSSIPDVVDNSESYRTHVGFRTVAQRSRQRLPTLTGSSHARDLVVDPFLLDDQRPQEVKKDTSRVYTEAQHDAAWHILERLFAATGSASPSLIGVPIGAARQMWAYLFVATAVVIALLFQERSDTWQSLLIGWTVPVCVGLAWVAKILSGYYWLHRAHHFRPEEVRT